MVWLPMAWLGTISRLVTLRLPEAGSSCAFGDGRLYERLGVRLIKRLLRRGPFAVFNPGLHLPAGTPQRTWGPGTENAGGAGPSHSIPVRGHVRCVRCIWAAAGWWSAAGWIALFNVLVNGYPVMLQRYNRALLHQRFGADRLTASTPHSVAQPIDKNLTSRFTVWMVLGRSDRHGLACTRAPGNRR
ncbi:MAG: hypothetical protein R2789_15000 [Microthrixaceae bacterium]